MREAWRWLRTKDTDQWVVPGGNGTPASSAAVMNACLSVCGPTGLGRAGIHHRSDMEALTPHSPLARSLAATAGQTLSQGSVPAAVI